MLVVVLLSVALVAGAAFALTRTASVETVALDLPAVPQPEPYEDSVPLTLASTDQSTTVEVPVFIGKTVAEATVIADVLGLKLEIRHDRSTAGDGSNAITMQEPAAGDLVSAGSAVMIRVPAAVSAEIEPVASAIVVCIDPGHQSSSDLTHEPIGPGASETKERVRGGATGVGTRIPEYEVALQIAFNLKKRLEAEGVSVVMTRITNDVNVSNAERAQIANDAQADLFVRIHADGSTDSSVAGISTLYPASNNWTASIAADSKRAAGLIQDATVLSTGAGSRGTVARGDISGFNWSRVPAVLVECGFLSNPVEDKLLASPHYQDKLAQGITAGILAFTGSP